MKIFKAISIPFLLLALAGCSAAMPSKTSDITKPLSRAADASFLQTSGWGTRPAVIAQSDDDEAEPEISTAGWGMNQASRTEKSLYETAGWGTSQPVNQDTAQDSKTSGWGTLQGK